MVASARMAAIASLAFAVSCMAAVESEPSEFIICRKCGKDIADSHYLYNHLSPNSKIFSNLTIFGRKEIDVQALTNPMGVQFKIINTSKALCSGVGEWVSAFSWFPGFVWKFCICPDCSLHLGWIFEPESSASPEKVKPSEEGFYALILDNIIGEKYLESLMVSPKISRS